jgi:hypothetical protein
MYKKDLEEKTDLIKTEMLKYSTNDKVRPK